MTREELEEQYKNKEKTKSFFALDAMLGTESEGKKAYDQNGIFHCIGWFDCRYCPAFNATHCA